MNKAISSFAMIRSNSKEGNDYIDAFVPLLVLLFASNDCTSVDVETICTDFSLEYGLKIPRFPMQTILNRMKKKYLSKKEGKYYVDKEQIFKVARDIDYKNEQEKYNSLLRDFISFCGNFETPLTLTMADADELFLAFFKEHDLDMIFAVNEDDDNSLIFQSSIVEEPRKRYLLNRYINSLMVDRGELSDFLIDCAIGHFYASTILYRDFANMKGRGFRANCYLDSGIIFDLLGINGNFRKISAGSFLKDLKNRGSSLFLFKHHYENEILQIIEDCIRWINNPLYDSTKASRALHYFKDNGKSQDDIALFLVNIPDILSEFTIEIINSPNPNRYTDYQIDEEVLKDIILDTYNKHGILFNEEERENTIQADIKSISNIYKLRKNNAPIRINDVSHVFITSNGGLAYATKRFECEIINRNFFTIPAAITDTFLGTIMWLENPTKSLEEFNRGKLIAYSSAVIQPNRALMQRFIQEVKIAQTNPSNPITDENTTLLLETKLSRDLLSDLTLGDPNAITHQTPYELLKMLQDELVKEEHKKYLEEQRIKKQKESENRILRKNFIETNKTLGQQVDNTNSIINKISSTVKWVVVGVLLIISGVIIYFDIFSYLDKNGWKFLLYVLQYGPIISGFSILGFGKKFEELIRRRLTNSFIVNHNNISNLPPE